MPELDRTDRQNDVCILLYILGEPAPLPWTVDELGRELGDPTAAHDAVARLVGTGLLHRLGEFVFPTRAGRRAYELQVGTV